MFKQRYDEEYALTGLNAGYVMRGPNLVWNLTQLRDPGFFSTNDVKPFGFTGELANATDVSDVSYAYSMATLEADNTRVNVSPSDVGSAGSEYQAPEQQTETSPVILPPVGLKGEVDFDQMSVTELQQFLNNQMEI